MSSPTHLAAILSSKGSIPTITTRPTPTPGPHEVLIEVHSIALNPIDHYMRDFGMAIASYPATFGSDIGGTIVATGPAVPAPQLQPGTRVAAFAPTFFAHGDPDYGAFQKKALVPAALVTPVPADMSFDEASILGMAVLTAWSGWYSIGLPLREDAAVFAPAAEKKKKKQQEGMLVWGGASSIGTAAVQSARMMGFTVYATASARHHTYIKQQLGAEGGVFDYKSDGVVQEIVGAAKRDGCGLRHAFDAVGEVRNCLDVLKEFKGAGGATTEAAAAVPKLATAKPTSPETPKESGVEVRFVAAPAEEEERTRFFQFVMNRWLAKKLATGEYKPSPSIKKLEGGLEGLNQGLDVLKAGVSGTKLVLEI
ncbi:MAG: hypothetical protein Q9222_004830 [Ikaeria aurantiellina]